MRRLLKAISKLYPPAWRERYGAEFDALLEDRTPRAGDIADVLRGALKMRLNMRAFSWIVIPCGLVGSLIGLGGAAGTPLRYNSEVLIKVTSRRISPVCSNQNDLPAALRGPSKGVCDEPGAAIDQQMRDWIRPDFDPKFLTSIIAAHRLYPEQQQRHVPVGQLVDTMRKNVDLVPVKVAGTTLSTRTYRIQFQYSDPQIARDVVAIFVHHAADSYFKSMSTLRKAQGPLSPQEYARTWSLDSTPSLPTKPAGLPRIEQAEIGLAAGILGGLLVALANGPLDGITSSKHRQHRPTDK